MHELTPEQKETQDKNWLKGKAPVQCTGDCDIDNGFLFMFCNSCCWNNAGSCIHPGQREFTK
jgi:hypothetical protein